MSRRVSTKPGGSTRPRRGNLGAQTAERLRDLILRGEYAFGQPLRELELCRVLGVSRIPLREALHRLEGEGLVHIRPNLGARVAPLSVPELNEIAEACRLLESHLLALAVPAANPVVLERAEACLARLDRLEDPLEWARENWRFHTTLYALAARPLQVEILTGLRTRAQPAMLTLVAERARRVALNREHRAILDCVRAGRAAKAVALLDAHLRGGKERVLRLLGGK